jgi:ribonuclease HI
VIKKNGKTIDRVSELIGRGEKMTNNLAEYTALVRALEKIKGLQLDKEKIIVRSDSRLVAIGMSQGWKIKAPTVLPLFAKAKRLASDMHIMFQWIPREENEEADGLCRLAYKSQNLRKRGNVD